MFQITLSCTKHLILWVHTCCCCRGGTGWEQFRFADWFGEKEKTCNISNVHGISWLHFNNRCSVIHNKPMQSTERTRIGDNIYTQKPSKTDLTVTPESSWRLTSPARRRRTPRWWCHTWGWSPWPRGSMQWWLSYSAPGLLCPTQRRNHLALPLATWLIFTHSGSANLTWPSSARICNGEMSRYTLLIRSY